MSTAQPVEVLLGCDPQVRVVIIEDGGNLVLQVFSESPEVTDIDALFFNLTNDADATALTIFPEYDETIGSNGQNVTGFDVTTGALNQLNNGAQIQDTYDVRIEFGTVPYSSGGDVDQAALTLYVDGNGSNLTADSIDLSNMTAVINSDGGAGVALTSGTGGVGGPVYEVLQSEDFDGLANPSDSGNVVYADRWDVRDGELAADGCNDGHFYFEQVAVEGDAQISFDARVINPQNFENGGCYGDSLEVWAWVDDSQWVHLDTFVVNDAGTALVGSETGQEISADSGTVSYSGGALDDVQSVQLYLGADFTASNEEVRIDNVEIGTMTDAEDCAGGTVEELVAAEDFDDIQTPAESDFVNHAGYWDVENGELTTDGCNDGQIWFDEVSVNGDATISFDASAPNTDYFENGGCYGDSLDVWVLTDGTDWTHLDTFVVNDAGTALVGSNTGQEIDSQSGQISYSGGDLDNVETVQLYMYSDISASNEEIRFDNFEVSATTEAACDTGGCGQYDVTYDDLMKPLAEVEELLDDATDDEVDILMASV